MDQKWIKNESKMDQKWIKMVLLLQLSSKAMPCLIHLCGDRRWSWWSRPRNMSKNCIDDPCVKPKQKVSNFKGNTMEYSRSNFGIAT